MTRVGFDHIAIATARLTDAPAFLVGELGGVPEADGPSREFRWACWRFAGGGRLEVLEPRGEEGFLHRFLSQHGPGVHHVTFRVPSRPEACDRARARGYAIVGYDDRRPQWAEAFLHPKEALGIVVQMAESSGEGPRRPWQGPPGPPHPPPAVTVVGLRLRARSAERARGQWEGILAGEPASRGDGALGFRWPGSPMRLAVEIDPAGEDGPVSIEVASDRALALPPGPHPALGAVFVQPARPAVS